MAIPASPNGVPPWTVENYVLQNPRGGRKSPEITRLEHINGDEPYWLGLPGNEPQSTTIASCPGQHCFACELCCRADEFENFSLRVAQDHRLLEMPTQASHQAAMRINVAKKQKDH